MFQIDDDHREYGRIRWHACPRRSRPAPRTECASRRSQCHARGAASRHHAVLDESSIGAAPKGVWRSFVREGGRGPRAHAARFCDGATACRCVARTGGVRLSTRCSLRSGEGAFLAGCCDARSLGGCGATSGDGLGHAAPNIELRVGNIVPTLSRLLAADTPGIALTPTRFVDDDIRARPLGELQFAVAASGAAPRADDGELVGTRACRGSHRQRTDQPHRAGASTSWPRSTRRLSIAFFLGRAAGGGA